MKESMEIAGIFDKRVFCSVAFVSFFTSKILIDLSKSEFFFFVPKARKTFSLLSLLAF